MRRLITYSITFLLLILIELLGSNGSAFTFKTYDLGCWIAQLFAILLAIGISEEWYKDWIEPSKT